MIAARIGRTVVSFASLFFAGLALGIWVAPEYAARQAGVEAVRSAGTAMLRADGGGLFAGMAVLCGAAAWTGRRSWIVAAGTMLTAIATGRALGWINAGRIGSDAIEMAIELGIIAALVAVARQDSATASSKRANVTLGDGTGAVAHRGRTSRKAMIAAALLVVPVAGAAVLMTPGMDQRIFDRAAQRQAATINTAPRADDAAGGGVHMSE